MAADGRVTRASANCSNLLALPLKAYGVSSPDQITRDHYANRRRFFILLLLAVTLFAQSAALISEHQQHHATEHCCLLCHVSLPFLQGQRAGYRSAVDIAVQWLAAAPQFESFRDVFLSTSSSRGPPAPLLTPISTSGLRKSEAGVFFVVWDLRRCARVFRPFCIDFRRPVGRGWAHILPAAGH